MSAFSTKATFVLGLGASLAACTPNFEPDKVVMVNVSWLTDRTRSDQEAFGKELGDWFAPFRADEPCSTQFYFRVTFVRMDGNRAKGLEPSAWSIDQKPDDLAEVARSAMQRIMLRPAGFLDIQNTAKADLQSKALPPAPTASGASALSAVAGLHQQLKPMLVLYKHAPMSAAPPAGAPASFNLDEQQDEFRAQLRKAFCPDPKAGAKAPAADKETPAATNVSVLLVDAEKPRIDVVVVPPPRPAPPPTVRPAPVPKPSPSPTSTAAPSPPPAPQPPPQAEDTRRLPEPLIRPPIKN